jgi:hypothetical protein
MIANINQKLLSVLSKKSNVEYQIDWILGYIHRKNSLPVSDIVSTYKLKGPTIEVDLPNELIDEIKEKFGNGIDVDTAANFFLLVAFIMGEGE